MPRVELGEGRRAGADPVLDPRGRQAGLATCPVVPSARTGYGLGRGYSKEPASLREDALFREVGVELRSSDAVARLDAPLRICAGGPGGRLPVEEGGVGPAYLAQKGLPAAQAGRGGLCRVL